MNKNGISVLVQLSGGKDSHATLIQALKDGWKKERVTAVFCDTGWEHPLTITKVFEICAKEKVKLVVLRDSKNGGGG